MPHHQSGTQPQQNPLEAVPIQRHGLPFRVRHLVPLSYDMRGLSELPLLSGHSPASQLLANPSPQLDSPAPHDSQDPHRNTVPPPRPASAARPSTNRTSPEMNGHSSAMARSLSGGAAVGGRPSLQRAKSDFGPRRQEPENADEEVASSVDGDFKIRHGWETQLTSPEYNNHLTAVSHLQHPRCLALH